MRSGPQPPPRCIAWFSRLLRLSSVRRMLRAPLRTQSIFPGRWSFSGKRAAPSRAWRARSCLEEEELLRSALPWKLCERSFFSTGVDESEKLANQSISEREHYFVIKIQIHWTGFNTGFIQKTATNLIFYGAKNCSNAGKKMILRKSSQFSWTLVRSF